MALINENYLKISDTNCFDELEKAVNVYKLQHPNSKLLRLDVGGGMLSLTEEVISALRDAVDEMGNDRTFRGYGPVRGYEFLISKIQSEYRTLGVNLEKESIFISEGAKNDICNIGHILGRDNIIAIAEPIHPMYENATILSGRAGSLKNHKWSNVVYLKCNSKTAFVPQLPDEKVDIIYLCNPNNPTGTTISRNELKLWVDYALENRSIIVYDAAYHAYVTETDIPHSIYEIKNARKVAIEIKSYSKTAGFMGLRCGYTVIPAELAAYTQTGEKILLTDLWNKRKQNYTNGISYITMRAAEAVYSRQGKAEQYGRINYYLANALIIKEKLATSGFEVYGGVNSPYVWFRTPDSQPSMKYFQQLLYETEIVGAPGVLFGKTGECYMRFSGFNTRENTVAAMNKLTINN